MLWITYTYTCGCFLLFILHIWINIYIRIGLTTGCFRLHILNFICICWLCFRPYISRYMMCSKPCLPAVLCVFMPITSVFMCIQVHYHALLSLYIYIFHCFYFHESSCPRPCLAPIFLCVHTHCHVLPLMVTTMVVHEYFTLICPLIS